MTAPPGRPPRLLWVVNHKALIPAELPLLRELGFEIFVPKIIPGPGPFRSGAVTRAYDATLTLPAETRRVLDEHPFYADRWSPTLRDILAREFDVAVINLSPFLAPLREAVRHFPGAVVARAFGLPQDGRYEDLLAAYGLSGLLGEIAALGPRFTFAQGYDHLAEREPEALRARARTVILPLPPPIFAHAGRWSGDGGFVLNLCPSIQASGYERDLYDTLRRHFGDLPYRIFGQQLAPPADPSILPYVTDEALAELYASAAVFLYLHREARQIHYSPVEAMVVGTPVLYRRGTLIDALLGDPNNPGACSGLAEMREKAGRLVAGDTALADEIRARQAVLVERFRPETARRQWAALLEGMV